MNPNTPTSERKLITPTAILSYPHLFEPKPKPNSTELQYSCALIFPAGTDMSAIHRAIDAAGQEKFGTKWSTMKAAGRAKLPLRDDWEDKGYPEGSVYFNCSSKTPPGVVQPFGGPDDRPAKVTNPEDIYPGCYVRASVNFFGFDTQGNKGVAVGLNNLQKLRDGDRLDGRRNAQDEFDAVADAAFEDASSLL